MVSSCDYGVDPVYTGVKVLFVMDTLQLPQILFAVETNEILGTILNVPI